MPDSSQQLTHLAERPAVPQTPQIAALTEQVLASARDRISAILLKDPRAGRSRLGAALNRAVAVRDVPDLADRVRAFGSLESARPHLGRAGSRGLRRIERAGTVLKAQRVTARVLERTRLLSELTAAATTLGWAEQPTSAGPASPKVNEDLLAGLKYTKLKMFITEVRCREETDEVGADHVLIGGTRTNYLGETTVVDQWTVDGSMSSGGKRSFGMSKVFARWNLARAQDAFPYVYTAVVVLGEHDDGGFSDLVKEIWSLVDSQVKAAIGGLVGGAIGSALGPLGAVIGLLVGTLVGLLIDWVLSLFGANEDDLIDVDVLTMTLTASTQSYFDWAKLTSPTGWTKTLFMWGDGGRYEVDVAYRVFAE